MRWLRGLLKGAWVEKDPEEEFFPLPFVARRRFLDALAKIAREEDRSTADVLRRGVGLYALAKEREAAGLSLAFVNEAGEVQEIIGLGSNTTTDLAGIH